MRRFLTSILFLVTPMAASAQTDLPAVRAWREAHGAQILQDFARFLALPNVASDTEGVRRNAEHLRSELAVRGAAAEILEIDGAPPVVYGELKAPGAERTLGVYMHYDGQPVDLDEWSNPPWRPTLYTHAIEDGGERRPFPQPGEPIDPEWRIYGRSAGDDKAPAATILAALDALETIGVARSSNLRFFFEGEEEAGSEHLGAYIERYRDRLEAIDAWLICDGPVHQSRQPQLVFGVRGYTGFDLTVYGATRYLHSGHYGNWAPNPAMRLAQLLATMKDGDGKVLIEGFYDSVAPLTEADREALKTLPDYDEELRRELGLASTEGGGASLAERLLLPSLNVRGIESAEVGAAGRNVIPTKATASFDIRLVKGNDPAEMLDLVEAHLKKQGYTIVRDDPDMETRLAHPLIARVDRREGYRAARTSLNVPIVQQVIRAADRASDQSLVLVPTLGGSLPLYLFTEVLAKPTVVVPVANHDDNQHAPDENLRLANLWYGIDLMASLFTMD